MNTSVLEPARRTKRTVFGASPGSACALALGNCGMGGGHTYNVLVTVEVETPEVVRTGSSVMEISAYRSAALTAEDSRGGGGLRGEAVVVEAASGHVVTTLDTPGKFGAGIHEMDTACMGTDPTKLVLGKFNAAHDVPNLFVTDGAAMASSGCKNPSLTHMALSARAANHVADLWQGGAL